MREKGMDDMGTDSGINRHSGGFRALVEEMQRDWAAEKEQARLEALSRGELLYADKLAACRMFTGRETLEELAAAMLSPQGIEFLSERCFPSLGAFRRFLPYSPHRVGIFIDCGRVEVTPVGTGRQRAAMLVGDCDVRIVCDETCGYRIVLLHGAKAEIIANGWAVVQVTVDSTSHATCTATGHARITGNR